MKPRGGAAANSGGMVIGGDDGNAFTRAPPPSPLRDADDTDDSEDEDTDADADDGDVDDGDNGGDGGGKGINDDNGRVILGDAVSVGCAVDGAPSLLIIEASHELSMMVKEGT
jgi:hypothetical protein